MFGSSASTTHPIVEILPAYDSTELKLSFVLFRMKIRLFSAMEVRSERSDPTVKFAFGSSALATHSIFKILQAYDLAEPKLSFDPLKMKIR